MLAHRSPRLALAVTLLLGGCYVGSDLEDAGFAGPPGATADESASTGAAATTGEPSSGEPEPGTTGEVDEQDVTGAVDPTTGEPATTGRGPTGEPATTDEPVDPDTGDETGADEPPPPPPPVDVPDSAHCAPVAGWSAQWAQLEQDVLEITNQKRSQGANCGSKGAFGPAPPLTMNPALRCAARVHSADMAARNFFDHTNPDGASPWDRMGAAGYGNYSAAGENIAAGSPDAAGTMDQWMTSDGHCANIMNPAFKEIGVGYSTGGQYGHLWTQVFGAK